MLTVSRVDAQLMPCPGFSIQNYGDYTIFQTFSTNLGNLNYLIVPSTDLSPQEIASEMVISVTTVRAHARNAYHKLEVHSRFEAVQRAKEFALL